jgi:hypothetical protein
LWSRSAKGAEIQWRMARAKKTARLARMMRRVAPEKDGRLSEMGPERGMADSISP